MANAITRLDHQPTAREAAAAKAFIRQYLLPPFSSSSTAETATALAIVCREQLGAHRARLNAILEQLLSINSPTQFQLDLAIEIFSIY